MDAVVSLTGLVLIIAVTGSNLTLGLLVLLRNQKVFLNRLFLVFTIFLSAWACSSIISDSSQRFVIIDVSARLAYSMSFIGMSFIWLFSVVFAQRNWFNRKRFIWLCIAIFVIGALFFTKLLYKQVDFANGEVGVLFVPYISAMVILLGLTIMNMLRVVRIARSERKKQAQIILLGTGTMIICALLTNAILPILFEKYADSLTKLGPLFTIFFVGATAYAIIKHRLFDIRAVVARAFAYLLTTTIVVVIYVSLAFLLKRVLFPELKVTTKQLISNIFLSVLLVTGYPYIKRNFDKITNRLFFRDSYDSQEMINTLNKTLVNNVKVEKLLSQSADIVEKNIKSDFCSFYISDTPYIKNRMIGDYEKRLNNEEATTIKKLLEGLKQKVVYSEELDYEVKQTKELALILKEQNIEVLVRIAEGNKDDLGYLLLGSKRSGNLYTRQDVEVLEIIANELFIAVQNALRFEEIEQFSLTLQKKVDEATKELRKSNEKLKALDEAKDEFISMASHQLRTPLTSVKGYLSMLNEGDAGKLNETQKKFVDQAFISSQRMVYLIADLLNVSRLKTGKFIIEPSEVYLPDLIESEIAQLHETVASRGLTMSFNKPKEFPKMMLDETKIRQVVMNFTDNAIYYTPSGGSIVLNLTAQNGAAEFTVTDTGLGVPKSEQHHLFTKFYRAGNARKIRPDGTGLGLFMAKKVIVASGGAIIFKSIEGKGSTFGFRFTIK